MAFQKLVTSQTFDMGGLATSGTQELTLAKAIDATERPHGALVVRVEAISINSTAKFTLELRPTWPLATAPDRTWRSTTVVAAVEINSSSASGTIQGARFDPDAVGISPALDLVLRAEIGAGTALSATLSVGLLQFEA